MKGLTWLTAIFGLAVVLSGCQSGQLPNPNDEAFLGTNPDVMMRNLQDARARMDRRVAQRTMTPELRDKMMADLTRKYVELAQPEAATDENAWLYGDLFRDAKQWERALELYDRARKVAKTEDRRVNDSLRYARAAANLGRTDEAIEAVESTFNTPPEEKGPILPAVLYEIVPAAEAKGSSPQRWAAVLEKAIEQHLQTIVDQSTEPGQAFLAARPVHVDRAWSRVIALLTKAGRRDEARLALQRADEMLRRYRSL
ncbi:MAG: hypothetical protein MH204_06950 [Fimbriimonadaceae bacterium]|nr:hypothetical protein [Fimbriimonadaceae bacterium]